MVWIVDGVTQRFMKAINHGDGIDGSRPAISDLFDASDSLTVGIRQLSLES